ncbi:NADP-dependent oxidoreductase [Streptomyces carpinensis]|uniref:NADP-dependent oxidoreductase n=1 Tax=Streptomyces carpinensis TaxID=66369 RepID=A0ABV1VWX7_9ACTN|nr:NADP-dependent oxidoreductase [Streptomyces carpinensis]
MKAIGLTTYGGPDVLHPVELDLPTPGPGEVRVKVRAAGVNPADAMLRDGSLADWYQGLEPPFIPGMDVAGTIDATGPDLTAPLAVGDEVVGIVDNRGRHGGYSEYVVLPTASVTPKPRHATWEEAASFLMNALTARVALDARDLPAGATLLVTGAAGAVGGYAVQLACADGLRVIAVASRQDESAVRGFGAHEFIDRDEVVTQRVLDLAPGGVDGLVDTAMLHDAITPTVRDGGQIAVLRFWNGTPGRGITVHPINVRNHATDRQTITGLRKLVESGALALRVAGTFPADQAPQAHRQLDKGGLRGRIVLTFPHQADRS